MVYRAVQEALESAVNTNGDTERLFSIAEEELKGYWKKYRVRRAFRLIGTFID
jgi:hypothetical protein